MHPSRLNACRLVTIVWLCFAMCQPVWGYGWTGHWRVMEAAWPSLGAGLCDGQSGQHTFKPGALDLTRQEIALAAGLGAVISDIGYITQGTEQFSDLMHYVGTGNYIGNLVKTTCAKYGDDPAMIAFLAGVRSHYWADRVGHHEGTNVAVATLSARNHDKALTRVAYEMDIPMHKRLELGAFSVYDLRYGTVRVATSLIVGGGESRLVERAAYVLAMAAEMTYGKAGAILVPDYATILTFLYHVSDSVCQTAQATYGEGPARTADLRTMLDACKKMVQTVKVTGAQKDPASYQLAAEGIQLANHAGLATIYEASIDKVTAALRYAGKGPLANYNLDTNLPSVGGQYAHADVAYRRLGAAPADRCDPAHPEAIVTSAFRDWHGYQPAGVCVRHAASEPMRTLSCAARPPSAAQALIERYWLWDLAPPPRADGAATPAQTTPASAAQADSCRPVNFRWQQTAFRMDAQCVLSAAPSARAIDLMLACPAARNGSTRFQPDEALDRLRLAPREYSPLDPATGLYR
ncbi:zinc dependent phospholipase C family protein [Cupriavidus basilensis]